jgi:hypothetical protein
MKRKRLFTMKEIKDCFWTEGIYHSESKIRQLNKDNPLPLLNCTKGRGNRWVVQKDELIKYIDQYKKNNGWL